MSGIKEFWESERGVEYAEEQKKINQTYADNIIMLLQPKANESVLDVGCGTGNLATIIGERTGTLLVGMDISSTLIELAKKNYPSLDWHVGNMLEKWPFPDSKFEKVYSRALVQHAQPGKELAFVIKETRRVLKSNGVAIHFDVPDKTKLWKYYDTPYKKLRGGIKSSLSNKFGDISYWHSPSDWEEAAKISGFSLKVVDSWVAYRSHLILS